MTHSDLVRFNPPEAYPGGMKSEKDDEGSHQESSNKLRLQRAENVGDKVQKRQRQICESEAGV